MRTPQILLLCFLLLFSSGAFAQHSQHMSSRFEKDWNKIDSLYNRDLPESAAKQLNALEAKLGAAGDPAEKLKVQIYRMGIAMRNTENPDSFSIAYSEARIAKSAFPQKAVWQSIAASQYWSYYQNHRYEILQRAATTDSSLDFAFWDTRRFVERASTLYHASVSNMAGLKAIPLEQYEPVVISGENTRQLRPTLFDLLAFRAISYFENDEKDLSRPAFQFIMDDNSAFDDAAAFAQHKFKTQDTTSMQFQALQLYQEIIRLHLKDSKPDALIDADLLRLAFAYQHSVSPDKKERYRAALERIERAYATNPMSAQASFLLAQLMMETTPGGPRKGRRPGFTTQNLPAVKTRLDAIVAKFPKSEGGANAAQLLASILTPSLGITSEEAVLPEAPSKILVTYRNQKQVWLRVVKMDPADYRENGRYNQDAYAKKLLTAPQVQAFSVALPGTEDFAEHRAEVKIDALPLGMYAILISGKPGFDKENNLLSFAITQSTRLALIQAETRTATQPKAGFVIDRQSGAAAAGAEVALVSQKWNDSKKRYEFPETIVGPAGADGSFSVPNKDRYYNGIILRKGTDLFASINYLSFEREEREKTPATRTILFTDRAIYRPGQTVYFKGILLENAADRRSSQVIAGRDLDVYFRDANSQQIELKKLKTNDWGSVSGSFVIPTGSLNGQFRIETSYGSVYFSVEEYKRPKFRVDWEPLKSDYALNDSVSVTGTAQAYAGNNVDGATVKYRVLREVRWPFWWYYSRYGGPSSAQQEIASGEATTDASGKFRVSFKTLPDRSIDERSLPVFTYVISADVTDINGETRSGTQRISAGYRSLQFQQSIPESGTRKDLDTLHITTTNLNGAFVAASVSVKVAQLKQPEVFYRSREWAVPDEFTMTEAQFRAAFPLDAYKDEADHTTWAEAATTADLKLQTTENGRVAMPSGAFNVNGWYLITLKMKDKAGKEIEEKKYVQVWDAANSGKPYEGLLTVPQMQALEPGEKASVHLSSALSNLKIIRMQRSMDGKTTIGMQELNAPFLLWSKAIEEGDRGGIQVSYVTVKDNRPYVASAFVNVPWTNKDLNIEWETHRDKLLPGAAETWTLRIKGAKGEQVASELAATLYDASLDAFRPHGWSAYGLFASLDQRSNWSSNIGFGVGQGRQLAYLNGADVEGYEKSYDMLEMGPWMTANFGSSHNWGNVQSVSRGVVAKAEARKSALMDRSAPAPAPSVPPPGAELRESSRAADGIADDESSPRHMLLPDVTPAGVMADPPARKNLQETAFFFPQLRSEADGSVKLQFTIPEALTEWNLIAFAHTKDLRTGVLAGSVKTQKDLMVQPGLPRFLRQGDAMTISTKIANLSDKALSGTATLEILDANTLQPLALPFHLAQADVSFKTESKGSTSASWTINVPENRYEPVIIRIRAKAGAFTDGEENMLPVLSNRTLVTETLPLWIAGAGSKTFSFDKLKQSGESKTLAQHALTVEYTANPAWLAVQALPYLMEYPYECAEQTFNRYYANALGAHILGKAPKVKAIFERWETMDTAALQSALSKNEELKSALLEETPWVLDAQNETAQKHNLALLFNTAKLARSLSSSAKKLEDMFLPEGGWPWFKGAGRPDRYITQYILTGIGRLKQLGISDNHLERVTAQALNYADRSLEAEYQDLLKSKLAMDKQRPGNSAIQWMYMRSFFSNKTSEVKDVTIAYFRRQSAKFWPEMNPFGKGVTAIALKRSGDAATPKTIIQSLHETSIQKEEMGMYWLEPGRSWFWWEAPIETQALLIEAFTEVENDAENVDKMKRWLLKQKQTNSWPTTKATADACYALLLRGDAWLTAEPTVTISLGDRTIRSTEQGAEAGTGYFRTRIPAADVKPEMGAIRLEVANGSGAIASAAKQPSWGAVYWQYFENTDKVTAAATPLEIRKTLYIQRNGDRGPELQPVNGQLKTGDKVVVRLEITVDREMEYVHLKDGRAACMEPVNVLSGYRWKGGLGYYESTKDASSNFFFDYLPKGKHVLEYPVFITGKGDYSNGLATIQCMYAPEFNAHSAGGRVVVK
jgi:uncharacterized protein YfaS (alpha-2-macroglobulin family)